MNKWMLVVVLMLVSSGWSSCAVFPSAFSGSAGSVSDDGTEYWALLVGCNEFMNMPSATLPGNDIAAKDFYKTLLASDHWKQENIRLLTGKNASSMNILQALKWLEKMDDEDDICLFYIATHGGPGPDYFPKDEVDGMDEWLTTYSTYSWYLPKINGAIQIPYIHRLSDDQINYMLSRLDAKGVCAIIDACYSGGFNETPYRSVSELTGYSSAKEIPSAEEWMKDFSNELAGSGRVVLMSTTEDKVTLTWYFAHCIMEGLQGFGDTHKDTIISAEEAFKYGAPKTTEWLFRKYGELYEPQILDDYEGDLPLTDSNLPPERAKFSEPIIGKTNNDCIFSISSTDPEENKIQYHINWGDDTEERTNFVKSGESITLKHSWETPGTYNVWYNNEDEYGVVNSFGPLHDCKAISITKDTEKADQEQRLFFDGADVKDGVFSNKVWLAQSFIPTYSVLSRVDLLISTNSYYVSPLRLSIRNNLTSDDLCTISVIPKIIDNWFTELLKWTTFTFPDINVVPGETYYLIIHCEQSNSLGAWMNVHSDCVFHPDYMEDPYINGKPFLSKNLGKSWTEFSAINDFCFVTCGK